MVELLTGVVDQMDVDSGRVRVAAVKFADNSSVEFQLDKHRSKQVILRSCL